MHLKRWLICFRILGGLLFCAGLVVSFVSSETVILIGKSFPPSVHSLLTKWLISLAVGCFFTGSLTLYASSGWQFRAWIYRITFCSNLILLIYIVLSMPIIPVVLMHSLVLFCLVSIVAGLALLNCLLGVVFFCKFLSKCSRRTVPPTCPTSTTDPTSLTNPKQTDQILPPIQLYSINLHPNSTMALATAPLPSHLESPPPYNANLSNQQGLSELRASEERF